MKIIVMTIILLILRIIFYPFKILVGIIYDPNIPPMVGYSWYSRAEYEKMLKTAIDEDIITSYNEWKENAEETITALRGRDLYVLKVHIKSAELNKWLRHNKLANSNENRQLFIGNKVSKFSKDPSI